LYLNQGNWQGRQLLPAQWVSDSLTPHIETDLTPGYGYQWWVHRFESPASSMWVPSAVGNGGQRIFLLQPLNMAVIITAGNYDMVEVPMSGIRILEEAVFPAAGMSGMQAILMQ
jgi:CubicO group peptidase (beta-lactamase class C family)